MNLSTTIIPRTDQKNADCLIEGPETIKITSVESGTKEQPVVIHYEGENGRPYKPCLSMRRVLVAMWGAEGSAYVGRRLTLYCDPSVKFGGETTGGIRISHASDIPATMTMALTMTRGKRKPFTVEPLPTVANSATTRPLDELIAAGETIAATGVDALGKWWSESLTQPERVALKAKLPDLKAIAAKVTT